MKINNKDSKKVVFNFNPILRALTTLTMLGCAATLIVGCTSNTAINGAQHQHLLNQSGVLVNGDSEQIGLAAKAQINATSDAMLKRPFAYETTVMVSNSNRRAALDNATPEQLANAYSRDEHCEYVHDNAYAQVLTDYKNDGHDDISEIVTAAPYATKLEQIKADYLSCYDDYMTWTIAEEKREREEYKAWLDEMHGDDDDDNNDDDNNDDDNKEDDNNQSDNVSQSDEDGEHDNIEDSIEDSSEVVGSEDAKVDIDVDVDVNVDVNVDDADHAQDEATDEDDVPEFMQDYDYNHTKLNVKKSKLLDAYLLKRANSHILGTYRPLSGQLTVMPSLSYQGQNVAFSIAQPLLIDLRQGDVYLWADTVAIGVSEYLDDKLGTSWKHKWLKISLNDGTLPDGFAKDMLQTHIEASKVTLNSQDNNNFSYITLDNADNLSTLSVGEGVDLSQLPNTDYAIEYRQKLEDIEQSQQVYFQYIYETMIAKYPDFIEEEVTEDVDDKDEDKDDESLSDCTDDEADTEADDISDGENNDILDNDVNDSDSSDDDTADSDETEDNTDEPFFSAKIFMTEYLKIVKEEAGLDQDEEDENALSCDGQNKEGVDDAKSEIEEEEPEYIDDKYRALYQYGYNQRGDLKWMRLQVRFESADDFNEYKDNGEGVVITSMTTFSPITRDTVAFPSLPADAQRPTKSNTVDLIDYVKALQERYKEGEGAAFGRLIFKAFEGFSNDSTDDDNADMESDGDSDNAETNSEDDSNTEDDASVEYDDLEDSEYKDLDSNNNMTDSDINVSDTDTSNSDIANVENEIDNSQIYIRPLQE